MPGYVRSKGAYEFNDANQAQPHVEVEPGDVLPADHWAVSEAPDRFEPAQLSWQDEERVEALATTRREIGTHVERHGADRSAWPPGVRQRVSNLETRESRLTGELRDSQQQRDRLVAAAANPRALERTATAAAVPAFVSTSDLSRDPWSDNVRADIVDRARAIIARATPIPDDARQRLASAIDRAGREEQTALARWAAATSAPAYASAFLRMCADPQTGFAEFDDAERRAWRRVRDLQRSMQEGTGAAGGFMVPAHLDPAILLTNAGSINPLRRISRVETIATDAWNGVSSAGVTAEWKAESAEVADATPTVAQPSIPVHFGDAFVPFSFEWGMDASGAMNQLARLLRDAADLLMAAAYTTGTGTGQPKGVITSATGVNNAAGAFVAADVYTLQNSLPARFSALAQWCANLAVINTIGQFETTGGQLKFGEVKEDRLLRKPLNELSDMTADFTTTTSRFLLYGDFSEFVIVDRVGTSLEIVPHLLGANRRPTGERGALMWFRTGSDVVVPAALRVLVKTA